MLLCERTLFIYLCEAEWSINPLFTCIGLCYFLFYLPYPVSCLNVLMLYISTYIIFVAKVSKIPDIRKYIHLFLCEETKSSSFNQNMTHVLHAMPPVASLQFTMPPIDRQFRAFYPWRTQDSCLPSSAVDSLAAGKRPGGIAKRWPQDCRG